VLNWTALMNYAVQ